jgi:hypothetical protein
MVRRVSSLQDSQRQPVLEAEAEPTFLPPSSRQRRNTVFVDPSGGLPYQNNRATVSGFLYKQVQPYHPAWRKRWCELKGECIMYDRACGGEFDLPGHGTERSGGKIDLNLFTPWSVSTAVDPGITATYPHAFVLFTTEGTYHLAAETSNEAGMWINALRGLRKEGAYKLLDRYVWFLPLALSIYLSIYLFALFDLRTSVSNVPLSSSSSSSPPPPGPWM